MLFLGTMFAPTQDRGAPGRGFTHKSGDIVRVSAPAFGTLVNKVTTSQEAPPWTLGIAGLMRNLAQRGLLPRFAGGSMTAHSVYPSLRDKRVVVTGGGSSIGAAIVERFAQQGARVAFLDIAETDSRELERRLADSETPPRYYKCDLTDIAAIRELFPRIRSQLGPIDVLINNAANDDRHNVEEVTPAYWDERIAVNLRHYFFCAQAVIADMKAAGAGAILNLGSVSWHLALPSLAIYRRRKRASKA